MSSGVPRLGLLARLGFAGAIGAVVLVLAVTLDIRLKHDPAPPRLAQAAGPVKAAAAKARTGKGDSIAALIGGGDGGKRAAAADPPPDVTGSLPAGQGVAPDTGPVSGLPLPRFVSLKPDRVNVRRGPTRDQTVSFIFQRAGLPVEVVAEFENWRRVRDSQGSEGWVLQNLLSGRRTALVAPWLGGKPLPLLARADAASAPVAMLEPGVLASIKACSAGWCRINGSGFDGWIEQQKLWGAYPGESID
jgi:SH3-like domain-containing protein